jgi:hypothetical protein
MEDNGFRTNVLIQNRCTSSLSIKTIDTFDTFDTFHRIRGQRTGTRRENRGEKIVEYMLILSCISCPSYRTCLTCLSCLMSSSKSLLPPHPNSTTNDLLRGYCGEGERLRWLAEKFDKCSDLFVPIGSLCSVFGCRCRTVRVSEIVADMATFSDENRMTEPQRPLT